MAQRAYAEELAVEREQLEAQSDALEPVRMSRYAALELLSTVAFYGPEEIVLSRFSLRRDRSVEIRGNAPSPAVAAELQQALGNSPLVASTAMALASRRGSR
jgi:hypothetical protein